MNITVDADWLNSHIDDIDVVIIDSRGLVPFRFGHIKNALPLEVENVISIHENGSYLVIPPQTAEKVFSELGIDESKLVIVYGEYPDPSSARIVWTLIYYGHTNVRLLDIGFNQWLRKGLPVEKNFANFNEKFASKPKQKFTARTNHAVRANAEIIDEKRNNSDTVIIDARSPQEHFQARIPGSVLHNWENGLGDYGKMIKEIEKLRPDFEERGITKDKQIICYCHSGMRASHTYLQLKQAGFENVRLYDGSIIDWAQRKYPLR